MHACAIERDKFDIAYFRLGLEAKKEENLPDWYSQVSRWLSTNCLVYLAYSTVWIFVSFKKLVGANKFTCLIISQQLTHYSVRFEPVTIKQINIDLVIWLTNSY